MPNLIDGQYNATAPTVPDGGTASLQLDASGNLKVVAQASTADQDVNLAAVAGSAVATGNGTAAGAIRVALPTDGTGVVALAAGAAAIGSVTVTGGQAAGGATPTGNPMMIAFVGRATNQAAVSSNQVARPICTLTGIPVVRPYSIPELDWSYAAASGGIANTTTAVTFKAAHASERNYITWIQWMSESLTNATELAIRDGAGGTVLWRTKIPATTAVLGQTITLPTPIRGTAATLLEVLTITASGAGAVYFNAGGYTAP